MIKLGLAMVVAVLGTTSSLRFFEFWNCLVVLCYEVFASFRWRRACVLC